MSADQRDGSHCEAKSAVQAEELRAEAADDILDAAHQDREDQELHDADAALLQLAECCHVSDGAEERCHEDGLERGVHVELKDAHGSQDHMENSEDQSAHDRSRDAVLSQEFDSCDKHTADHQHDDRQAGSLVHIQFNNVHGFPPCKLFLWSARSVSRGHFVGTVIPFSL